MRTLRPALATASILVALAVLPLVAAPAPATPVPDATPTDAAPTDAAPTDEVGTTGEQRIESRGNRVSIFTGDIEIPANVRQRGVVFCLGCDVRVDGTVDEDIVVVGGGLTMTGESRRSVVGVLSSMRLDGADVGDGLVNVLGSLESNDTIVRGQVVDLGVGDWLPGIGSGIGVVATLVFWTGLLKLLGAFVLVVLVAVVVPERVRLIAEEAPIRYGTAWFVGLLVYVLFGLIVMPIALATLVGFPIAVIGFKAMKWLGIAGLFLAVGERFGRGLGHRFSLLAAVMVVFTPLALLRLAPLVLGLPGIVIALTASMLTWLFFHVPGVGIAVLTRFGTRRRGAATPPPPAPAPASPDPVPSD